MTRNLIVIVLTLLAFQCFGAGPVATVSSTQSIVVSGIAVPASRVMSWPVTANDEIVTQAAPALVRFTDGTVVTLQRNSRMKLQQSPSGVEVKVLAGSAMYDLKTHSAVSIAPALAATTRVPDAVATNPAARSQASASSNEAMATALVYRMPATAPSSGVVFAPAAISTGHFAPATGHQALTSPGSGMTVTFPNGIILQVTPIAQGPTQSTYVVNGILIPVTTTLPGTQYANVVNSSLIGSNIVVLNQGTGGQQVTIFGNNGTPLDPAATNQLLQQAAQNAVTNAPGATLAPTGPITIDPFSASGH